MNATKNIQNTWLIVLGFILSATPALASNPMENMIVGLRQNGFGLVLLWLLTLAVVYGILTQLKLPTSMGTRGVIAIAASFLVLLAAAGSGAAVFLSNLTTYAIVVGFGIIVTMILLELAGARIGTVHIFGAYPKFFASIIVIIAVVLFLLAGGINLISISAVLSPLVGCGIFLFIVVATIWTLTKNEK
jgi:hypothetical protein